MPKTQNYVDGFIVPVKKKKVASYKKMASTCGKIWLEHGAINFVECMADDVSYGKRTSFPRSVKLQADEVVFFSWITYSSRRDRDRVNKNVMNDPRMKKFMDMSTMPFDGKRMFWGGFKPLVKIGLK